MTQVSKRILARGLKGKVYQTFWEVVAKLKKSDEAQIFFGELFSKIEKINFTKRLSIVILLHKGYEWRAICDLLKVSPTTVAKMASKMESNGFELLFEKVESDEGWREFFKELGKLYLTVTHGDKVARLGDEGVERAYFPNKKKSLL